jgi:hypothetical protein
MPFPYAMRPFMKERVLTLKEDQFGCYGIFRGDICIYVGSGDLRERLLAHLNDDNPCITRQRPDRWTGIVTEKGHEREVELTLEYKPVCTKRVG